MTELYTVIAEVMRIPEEEISDTFSMSNSDAWDSLKHMELIVSIESTFNVTLSADDIVEMINIKGIKKILKSKGAI